MEMTKPYQITADILMLSLSKYEDVALSSCRREAEASLRRRLVDKLRMRTQSNKEAPTCPQR
jgi:hypothetical protein